MADLGSSTDISIYVGFWTNWSRGHLAGATLTLTHRAGALLTAFLAIFVAFVGTSFWRITRFTFHQLLSTENPRDGLYHQVQAILRNSETATVACTRLFYILWAWRQKARRPVRRLLPLLTVTILTIICFTVASIFSARISAGMSNEVLISSTSCGKIYTGDPNVVNSNMIQTILYPYLSQKATAWANYVETCYADTQSGVCNSFIKRQLTNSIDRNASCPFQADMCRSNNNQSIKIDTGPLYIDSDFGVNVPPSLRYTFRFVTHCAPIKSNGYKQIFNYSSESSFMRYFYGRTMPRGLSPSHNFTYTYEYPVMSNFELNQRTNYNSGMPDYRLG